MNDTAGKSYGDTRLASVLSPNNQVAAFSYYGNTGDERLKQISSVNNSGNVLNQNNYGYDPAGVNGKIKLIHFGTVKNLKSRSDY